jgi:hypothetical protein
MSAINFFKAVMAVQLFFAICITMYAYALPDDAKTYPDFYTPDVNIEDISGTIQDSLETQTNIPAIDLGALVFYSGNILVDLLLNFVFAIPQMLTFLLNAFMLFFVGADSFIMNYIQLFFSAGMVIFYVISLIQLLTNVRTGRLV